MSAIVKIEVVWVREYATGGVCTTCGDYLYLIQYRFTVDAGEKTINTDLVICNPCYDLLKDKDAVSKQD